MAINRLKMSMVAARFGSTLAIVMIPLPYSNTEANTITIMSSNLHQSLLRISLLLLTSFSLGTIAQAQFWVQTYGDVDSVEEHTRFTNAYDEGFILTQETNAMTGGRSWYHRTDSLGNELWTAPVNGLSTSHAQDIFREAMPSTDIFYTVGYGASSSFFPEGGFLTCSDGSGAEIYTRSWGADDRFNHVSEVDPVTIVASTDNYDAAQVFWFEKSTGDSLFTRTYSYGEQTQAAELHGLADEGVALFYAHRDGPGFPQEMCMLRTDAWGDTLWTACFQEEALTEISDGITTADGGFILAGVTIAGSGDQGIHLVKLDTFGNTVYERVLFVDDYFVPIAITETHDAGVMMVAAAGTWTGVRHLVRFDAAGDTLWSRIWHDESGFPTDIMTRGTDFALCGWKNQEWAGAVLPDAMLAYTDSTGYNANCDFDCVWPGDADADGIANNVDLLAIGIAYGETGPARPDATLAWEAQYAPAWIDTLPSGANLKHVDTDGNEIINDDDTLAIHLNYGLTHPLRPAATGAGGGVPLYLEASADSALAGDTITITVNLGSDSMSADMIYGIAFSALFDETAVDESTIHVSYAGSWLGDKGIDMLALNYNLEDRVDMALTRIDGSERTGDGSIAQIKYILDDDLGGKGMLEYYEALFDLANVYLIQLDGEWVPTSTEGVMVTVGYTPTSIDEPAPGNDIRVWPNPTQDFVQLELPGAADLRLFDLTGRAVMQSLSMTAGVHAFDVSGFQAGMYLIEVRTDSELLIERLIIR